MGQIGCIGHDGDCCKEREQEQKDAARFRFMVEHKIKCGLRENGYWEATSEIVPIPWVSRKTLVECIDVLMSNKQRKSDDGT